MTYANKLIFSLLIFVSKYWTTYLEYIKKNIDDFIIEPIDKLVL